MGNPTDLGATKNKKTARRAAQTVANYVSVTYTYTVLGLDFFFFLFIFASNHVDDDSVLMNHARINYRRTMNHARVPFNSMILNSKKKKKTRVYEQR